MSRFCVRNIVHYFYLKQPTTENFPVLRPSGVPIDFIYHAVNKKCSIFSGFLREQKLQVYSILRHMPKAAVSVLPLSFFSFFFLFLLKEAG